jgi:phage regulator Rha-like protein
MEKLVLVNKMSSREIAELTGKNHAAVLRDIRTLNESYDNLGLSRIALTFYFDSFNRNQPQFELTKIQTLNN